METAFAAPLAAPLPHGYLVAFSRGLASAAHRGQTDKSGSPYILHVADVARRAVERGAPDEQVAAAWLHDVVEDTPITLEDLRNLGIPATVLRIVGHLTKIRGETYDQFIERVAEHPEAILVKLDDIASNTSPERTLLLSSNTHARLAAKYQRAEVTLRAALAEHEAGSAG
jgi:(p)ppGpp synthase/HD superfamily hydrolase